MKRMGRKKWEYIALQVASEYYTLCHVQRQAEHEFHKKVKISVNGVSYVFPRSQVKYNHVMLARPEKQWFEDDEKGFGDCEAKTRYINKTGESPCFRLIWYISEVGELFVNHTIDEVSGQMHVSLTLIQKNQGPDRVTLSHRAEKVYKRVPYRRQDIEYMFRTLQTGCTIYRPGGAGITLCDVHAGLQTCDASSPCEHVDCLLYDKGMLYT